MSDGSIYFSDIIDHLREDFGSNSLEDVDLSNSSVDPSQLLLLCNSINYHFKLTNQSSRLRTLDLSGSKICGIDIRDAADTLEYDYSGLSELCNVISTCRGGLHLVNLGLARNTFGLQGFEIVAYMISSSSTLTELDLSECFMSPDGAMKIFQGLCQSKTIKTLFLRNNGIGDCKRELITDLAFSIASLPDKLSLLDLSMNRLGSLTVAIFDDLRCQGLQSLVLSYNEIDDNGAIAIGEFLKIGRGKLEQIDLQGNLITAIGINMIAQGIKRHKTLKHLGLQWNLINDEGAVYLASVLPKNSVLESLYLFGNRITADGKRALVENGDVSKRESYKSLDLDM